MCSTGPRWNGRDGKAVDRNRKRRDDFYLALRAFESCLGVALQSRSFYEDLSFTDADRERFKRPLAVMPQCGNRYGPWPRNRGL